MDCWPTKVWIALVGFSLGIYVSFIQQLRDAPSAILEWLLFSFSSITPIASRANEPSGLLVIVRGFQIIAHPQQLGLRRGGKRVSGPLEDMVFPLLSPRSQSADGCISVSFRSMNSSNATRASVAG